jgi:hypothetical protein
MTNIDKHVPLPQFFSSFGENYSTFFVQGKSNLSFRAWRRPLANSPGCQADGLSPGL